MSFCAESVHRKPRLTNLVTNQKPALNPTENGLPIPGELQDVTQVQATKSSF